MQALRILHATHRALIGEGPEVALVAEQRGSGRSGIGGLLSCLGARDRGLRNRLDPNCADVRTLGPQRLGALDPARHVEGAELRERGVEEWCGTLAVTGGIATRVHERLVVVDYGAQRPLALLVENRACLREPVRRLVIAPLKGTESPHGKARVAQRPAEIR